MKKLVAIAAIVTLLVLGGCTQGQTPASAGSVSSAAASSSSEASPGSAVSAAASGQSASTPSASVEAGRPSDSNGTSAEGAESLVLSVGEAQFVVALADTEAAQALVEQLRIEPVTVSLHAYGGFEQVGSLPWRLPTSDEQITTSPGDVMLYQGDQITIFTGSNSWAYTPLGSIQDAASETLFEVFGGDAAEITLSLV